MLAGREAGSSVDELLPMTLAHNFVGAQNR